MRRRPCTKGALRAVAPLALALTIAVAPPGPQAQTHGDDSGVVPLQRVHTGDLGVLIAVDVDVAGTRGRWIVDTGASRHLVSPAFARRHALRERRRSSAETAFGAVHGPEVDLPPLRIGGKDLTDQRALVLDLAALAGPAAAGIDGVLGAPWLADAELDLDLRADTLRTTRGGGVGCAPQRIAVPLELRRGLPVLELRVDGRSAERALLDTGHAGAMVRIDDDHAPLRAGVPVPGAPAVAARASEVAIGPLVRLDVPVTHLRAPGLRRALAADVGALAGMALLDGAAWQLRFGERLLCVEAQQRRLPGGFGLGLNADADGVFIDGIYDGSPAAAAGLCIGDRVRQWNGVPPASVESAWAAVRDRDEVTLVVEAAGRRREVVLRRAWFLPPLR